MTRLIRMIFAPAAAALLLTAPAFAQERGSSGLPEGPGNPLAVLQGQIDALRAQIANLSPGNAVEGGAEQDLVAIRSTVAGETGQILAGAGFTVTTSVPEGNPAEFPIYEVQFTTPFSTPPSVVVSVHGFFPTQPVQTISIDDGAGGITPSGFHVYIAQPSNAIGSPGSFGSQNWDFIAIGPR